jgi:hypothetical protein
MKGHLRSGRAMEPGNCHIWAVGAIGRKVFCGLPAPGKDWSDHDDLDAQAMLPRVNAPNSTSSMLLDGLPICEWTWWCRCRETGSIPYHGSKRSQAILVCPVSAQPWPTVRMSLVCSVLVAPFCSSLSLSQRCLLHRPLVCVPSTAER